MVLFDTVEFPSVLYACYRIGAVAVPTNVMLATGNVRYVFEEMHPTVLVYDDEIDLTVHPAVAAGSTMVVTTDWDPEPAPDTIEAYGGTLVVDVPTVARRIANLEDVDERVLSTPGCLMCMGSPLSRRLAETLTESVTPNVSTATAPPRRCSTPSSGSRTPGTRRHCRPAHAGDGGPRRRVRPLADGPARRDRPAGRGGEVVVRGEPVMDYYFGSEAETSEAVRNGWYYTDDLGVVDGDGYLAIPRHHGPGGRRDPQRRRARLSHRGGGDPRGTRGRRGRRRRRQGYCRGARPALPRGSGARRLQAPPRVRVRRRPRTHRDREGTAVPLRGSG